MEWFRFYHEVVDDPKVQRLHPILFKHWINILCLASRNSERGVVPCVADLAFGLRLSESKVRAICVELISSELIERDGDQLRMHGWSKRQKRSDDVTPRVNKHRTGNVSETVDETLQETELETLPHVRVENREEQNREEENPPTPPPGDKYSPAFEMFWRAYPNKTAKGAAWKAWQKLKPSAELQGVMIDAVESQKRWPKWTKDGGAYVPHPATWINSAEWEDEPPQITALNGMPPEIQRLPWNNAERLKWENDHRVSA